MTTLTAARKRATLELVANFLDNMGDALDHIADEMRYTDHNVYPAQTTLAASSYTDTTGKVVTVGSGGGGKSTSTSPVERTVIDARARLRDAEWNLWEQFNSIVSTAHAGSRQATAANKRRVPAHEAQRCNHGAGHKLEGFTLWQDEECERFPGDHPVIPGMCDHCVDRMNDWRIAHEYERITREADGRNYLAVRNVTNGPGGRFTAA